MSRHAKAAPVPAVIPPQPLRDMFGQVPISRHDVFAWLLGVVQMDPASERAATYVRIYGVVQKVTRAKIDGTFDEWTAQARDSARYKELVASDLAGSVANSLGLGDWKPVPLAKPKHGHVRMWKHRSKEEIAKERIRLRAEKALRKEQDWSMLQRLPKAMPPLSVMLQDIGSPPPRHLAKAMQVTIRTAKRWIQDDQAPHAVMLALFWVTRWGMSAADSNAHNDAVMAATTALRHEREALSLQRQMAQVERIADFGSANDPLPSVQARQITPPPQDGPAASPAPAMTAEVPLQRDAACAA